MRTLVRRWSLGLLPVIAACGITDVETNDATFDEDLFVEELSAEELETLVQDAEAQFDVEFLPGGMTASTLGVRTESMDQDDRIQSRIAALDGGGDGSLTLQLADIRVAFGGSTRFWAGDEELSREAFLDRVQEDRSQGVFSPVIAERSAATPQDPSNEHFVASDIVLGGDGVPALRLKLGRNNLEFISSPGAHEPDGWLKLLGRRVRLRMRDGTTHAQRHRHGYNRLEAFSGKLAEVDVDGGMFALADGTVVRVVRQTMFVRYSGYARSLRAVEEALAAGNELVVRGVGAKARRSSSELLGLKVAMKIEEPEQPVVLEFEGAVSSLNEVQGADLPSLVLGDGTVVRLLPDTELVAADDVSPNTVAGLREALRAGRAVAVVGRGRVETDRPLVLAGVRVSIRAEPEPEDEDLVEFGGPIDFVDSFAGMIFLVDGTFAGRDAELLQ